MWSLVTETKKSTDNRTENLPMTVDSQYHVGFSWARQPAIRFQQKFGNGFTAAASLEQAEYIYSATNAPTNFFIGNAGTGGGLYSPLANYSNNVAPDVIVKGTYDAKYGHFEVGGIARWFRDRNYPAVTTTAGANNSTTAGGGFFANLRMPATKYLDVGVHLMTGPGVGRYGTSTLPDVTVRPDGTLATIKSQQGLISLEGHPTKKLDIFGYGGGEYAQRTNYLSSTGKLVGYAPITSSNAGCGVETLPYPARVMGLPAVRHTIRALRRTALEQRVWLPRVQAVSLTASIPIPSMVVCSISCSTAIWPARLGLALAALPQGPTTWSLPACVITFPNYFPVEKRHPSGCLFLLWKWFCSWCDQI